MSFLGGLFSGIEKVASPFLGMIPGVGPLLQGGLSALSGAGDELNFGSLLSGGMSFLGSREQQSASSRYADRSNDLQLNLADTSMQRRVRDMEAAGLNPVLAGINQQGAGAFSPAMPQAQNSVGAGANSAVANMAATAQLRGVQLDNVNKEATNRLIVNQVRNTYNSAKLSEFALNAAKNLSDVEGSDFGKALAWVNAASQAVHGAGAAASSATSALPEWTGGR